MEMRGSGRGLFITLEGPDGAGKSSQARRLAELLRLRGLDVLLTREPGGTGLGERVRAVLLDPGGGVRDPLADALLFNAARRQLVSEVILPALGAGSVVVCDRFADSTLAYQGYGAGVRLDVLRGLAAAATGGLVPDRTILIDVPADHGLARRAGGPATDLTRFEVDEGHDAAFHERVRQGFLALAREEPDRWRVVDGTPGTDEVARRVMNATLDLLPASPVTPAG